MLTLQRSLTSALNSGEATTSAALRPALPGRPDGALRFTDGVASATGMSMCPPGGTDPYSKPGRGAEALDLHASQGKIAPPRCTRKGLNPHRACAVRAPAIALDHVPSVVAWPRQ